MIKSLFRNAIRNLIRKKSFALINIIGLSLGVTMFFMLFVYVVYENSYDEFLSDSNNTYRVELDIFRDGKILSENATATYSIGPLVKEYIPQVKSYGRAGFEKCLIYLEKQSFSGQELFWVDSTFLSTIHLDLIRGDAKNALSAPYTAVLSEQMAQKFFGNEDAINKTIFVNEHLRFTVTGVFKTLPHNSHFNFKLLLSLTTGDVLWPGWGTQNRSWGGYEWLYTYVNLAKNANVAEVEQRMNLKTAELLSDQLKADNYEYKFHLKPIQDIHLTSHRNNEFKINGSEQNTNLLLLISLLIIIIVWINYINIASSEAFEKAREVGIRKVNGSSRMDIVKYAMVEVFLLNLISVVITFVLIWITAGMFESIFEIPIKSFLQSNSYLYGYILAAMVIGTFVCGIYPAIVMATFDPNKVLKGTILSGRNKFVMRKSLLIFQLVVTIGLIVSAITIHKQIRFIQSANLGYDKESVLALSAPTTMNMDSTKYRRYIHFKTELLKFPNVKSVASSQFAMGDECVTSITYNELNGEKISGVRCVTNSIDEDFIKTYKVALKAGQNFKFSPQSIWNRVLINESAARAFGFKDVSQAVGQHLSITGAHRVEVIGVVSDYNQESLRNSIKPMVYFQGHPANFGTYSVKITEHNKSGTIGAIKRLWNDNYPNAPFLFNFVNSDLEANYKAEHRFGKLLVLFTTIAIVIACLGLFGLVIIINRKRIKEIGVRKVNGAKISEILFLLNKDFIRWVIIAFLFSAPVAWYGMTEWLSNFAYKTTMSWWIFGISGFLTLIITLLTISIQSYKAANYNPVKALKYE